MRKTKERNNKNKRKTIILPTRKTIHPLLRMRYNFSSRTNVVRLSFFNAANQKFIGDGLFNKVCFISFKINDGFGDGDREDNDHADDDDVKQL